MAIQDILLIMGIVFLVVSVVLAGIAFYVYRKEGIRSVLDDLSGKTRQTGINEQTSSAGKMASRRLPLREHLVGREVTAKPKLQPVANQKIGSNGETGVLDDADAPTGVLGDVPSDADVPTGLLVSADNPTGVLDTPDSPTGVLDNAPSFTLGDDSPTHIAAVGEDSRTQLLGEGQGQPTAVLDIGQANEDQGDIDDATTVLETGFIVTRSVLRIHSDVVITAGWENDE